MISRLPGLKGTGIAEAIWQVRPKVPIRLCTGYTGILDLDVHRAMGPRGPLLKPFLADALGPRD
jgi:hypothetical protein